ncbi:flagellar protein FlaG [bacterium]|nr:flagellar protein FlaG [bacterium]MBU1154170.1 flagellar protein FlaG [bacterium]MBU1781875.1 flagellar protein FlaG [bacterium]
MENMEVIHPLARVKVASKGEEIKKEASQEQEVERKKEEPEDITETVELLNKTSLAYDRGIEFVVHKDPDRIIIKVIDQETKEVIREVPSEEIMDLLTDLHKLNGLLFDKVS